MVLDEPVWVTLLCAGCLIIVWFMIPASISAAIARPLIHSDAAKLLAGFAGIIGFLVVLATAYQIKVELELRREDQEARRLERIERAFSRLLLPAAGNIGKGEALNGLISEGIDLDYLDLSCRAVGRWSEKMNACEKPAFISGAVFSRPKSVNFTLGRLTRLPGSTPVGMGNTRRFGEIIGPINIQGINVSDALFDRLTVDGFNFNQADISGAVINDSVVRNSIIIGRFDNMRINRSIIVSSFLVGTFDEMEISNSNMSGTFIMSTEGVDAALPTVENSVWAFADDPPKILFVGDSNNLTALEEKAAKFLMSITLCNPKTIDSGWRNSHRIFGESRRKTIYYPEFYPIYDIRRKITDAAQCEAMKLEEARLIYPDEYKFQEFRYSSILKDLF